MTTLDCITAFFCQVNDHLAGFPKHPHSTYGTELIHPMREGRNSQQIGRKGSSNHRWSIGGTTLPAAEPMWLGSSVGV
jgi:hypothetical protein